MDHEVAQSQRARLQRFNPRRLVAFRLSVLFSILILITWIGSAFFSFRWVFHRQNGIVIYQTGISWSAVRDDPVKRVTISLKREFVLERASSVSTSWWFEYLSTPTTLRLFIPLWAVFVPSVALAVALRPRAPLDPATHCPRCGYARRGLPPAAPCPECGGDQQDPKNRTATYPQS